MQPRSYLLCGVFHTRQWPSISKQPFCPFGNLHTHSYHPIMVIIIIKSSCLDGKDYDRTAFKKLEYFVSDVKDSLSPSHFLSCNKLPIFVFHAHTMRCAFIERTEIIQRSKDKIKFVVYVHRKYKGM